MPDTNPATPSQAGAAVKKPVLWTNMLTLSGLLFVGIGLVLMLTFWLFLVISPKAEDNQYLGIIGYMILPGVLVNGLILCPAGILWRKWRLKKNAELKAISVKRALAFLAVTFFLVMPVLGVAGYKGYHFTESAEFCGTICHNMDPQYVRYQQSPHARVTCAGCHIGPGASPFVKAKLSGLRQVAKTFMNTYPRPVPPAIADLRPARDTCEACHWPNQFFGQQLKRIPHFAPDEKNTRHEYEVMIKVGGLNEHLGKAEGIHAHMLDRIEYVSDDHRLDHIPWVRYKYPDGRTVVFRSDGLQGNEPPKDMHVRNLDCIDCHNLAGHEFLSPERAVDQAMNVRRLDQSLPFLKREAVRALSASYTTTDAAMVGLEKDLRSFFEKENPQLYTSRRPEVDRAVDTVKAIYKEQIHPEMKVDWRTYPNHIGHMESPGCFRCHDGLHVAQEPVTTTVAASTEHGEGHGGASHANSEMPAAPAAALAPIPKKITQDCVACHSFLYRTEGDPGLIREKKFDHPMKIHEAWAGLGPHEKMICTDCHDGGLGALGWKDNGTGSGCGDCHSSGRWLKLRDQLRQRYGPAPTTPVAVEH